MSDSLWPHGLYSPWNSLGQNTGVGSRCSLLQGIFPTRLLPNSHQLVVYPEVALVVKNLPVNAGDVRDRGLIPGSGRSAGERIGYPLQCSWAFLVPWLLKNPPAVQETWVRSLRWEDPLEKETATHSSILSWRIPWTVSSLVSQRVWHDWTIFTSYFMNCCSCTYFPNFFIRLFIILSLSYKLQSEWKSLGHVWLFVTPWTVQPMEFSRPEYWSG